MRIATLPTGDPVHRYEKCIVVAFGGKRRVLSTCPFHGGYREDLTAVFNNDINQGPGMECRMLSEDYEEHIKLMAKKLGL
ncbi:MAG TPA: adenosylcobinamide amidohydrolase, partial [Candidatus Blautia intestinigallinarum]|nr:adenosylcobinamide amidohydrolase [Candidatus Blautia intestinigallinarum]